MPLPTSTTLFPTGNYSGTQTSAAVTLDDAAQFLQFGLDRNTGTLWSQSGGSTAVELDVDMNDGNGFQFAFGFTTGPRIAGNAKDQAATTGFVNNYPLAPGTARRAQVKMTVSAGLMHSTGTLVQS